MELPKDLREVEVVSTLDGSAEKCLLYSPEEGEKVPLLVGLHTWSCDRFNQIGEMLPRCRERGWALILPEFRGPNLTTNPRAPEAGGSHLARQDIVDALDFALENCNVDADRIFLLGGSGGGHMSLMMAGCAPERFTAISSWVPITDMAAWHGQNPNYAAHMEAVCGGVPGTSAAVDEEYRKRSPLSHLEGIRRANLCVHHGRYDQSVPYSHTWELAQELEKLGPERFFFEIFDGGHEIRYDVGFGWFDRWVEGGEEREKLTG
jgi:dipeptidyl aminopeptidase/acylaminoacyl peptidase